VIDDYEIGWGKPPVGHRYKKGQSGNPKGRPRGTQNLKTDLKEELEETIVVQQGERTLRISKQRALVKTLIAKGLKGDTRAIQILVSMMHRKAADDDSTGNAEPALSAEENELWQGLVNEVREEKSSAPQGVAKSADEGDKS
jgi:hypothetical protein